MTTTKVTFQADFVKIDGTAGSGLLQFRPNSPRQVNAGIVIQDVPKSAALDGSGHVSKTLVFDPLGYTVTGLVNGISIPPQVLTPIAGATVDLGSLTKTTLTYVQLSGEIRDPDDAESVGKVTIVPVDAYQVIGGYIVCGVLDVTLNSGLISPAQSLIKCPNGYTATEIISGAATQETIAISGQVNTNLSGMASIPDAPVNVVAVPASTQLTINWSAPATDGGSAITGYIVAVRPTAGGTTTTHSVSGSTFTSVFTGLTNGTNYTITVTAQNAIGTGPATTITATAGTATTTYIQPFGVGMPDPLNGSDPRGTFTGTVFAPPGSGVTGAGAVPNANWAWQSFSDLGVCLRYIGTGNAALSNIWVRGILLCDSTVTLTLDHCVLDTRMARDATGAIFTTPHRGIGQGFSCLAGSNPRLPTIFATDCSFYTSFDDVDKNGVFFSTHLGGLTRCELWGGSISPDLESGCTVDSCWIHHPVQGGADCHLNFFFIRGSCAGATVKNSYLDQTDGHVYAPNSATTGITSCVFTQGSGNGNRLIGNFIKIGATPITLGSSGDGLVLGDVAVAAIYNQSDTGMILQNNVLSAYAGVTAAIYLQDHGAGSVDVANSFGNKHTDSSQVAVVVGSTSTGPSPGAFLP